MSISFSTLGDGHTLAVSYFAFRFMKALCWFHTFHAKHVACVVFVCCRQRYAFSMLILCTIHIEIGIPCYNLAGLCQGMLLQYIGVSDVRSGLGVSLSAGVHFSSNAICF